MVEHALADGYAGVAGALLVLVTFLAQFARLRWPGLLFWAGAALGVAVSQGVTLTGQIGRDDAVTLAVNGIFGGLFGMLAGGMAADWWEAHVHDR